jgi:hypothetical protein
MQYATVESAFMSLYGIAEPGRIGLRARMKRLAQLGVPVAEGLGSGARRDYTLDHLNELLLALEAEQLDLGPVVAARLIKKYWRPHLHRAFGLIERSGPDNPVFFWLAPAGISDGLRQDDLPKYVGFFSRFDHGRDEFEEAILPKLLVTWRPPGAAIGDCPPRLSIINLSLQKRRLDRAVQTLEQAGGDDEHRTKRADKRRAPSRKRRAR